MPNPPDDIAIAPRAPRRRARPQNTQLDAGHPPPRRRRRWLWMGLLVLLLSPVWLIALGRFLPIPVTSYMLQSPLKPVQHQWVPASQIADSMRRAVVAAEDQKFWQHKGFDVEAIQQAYESNQRGGRVRGGSTISQQTAKNLFLWPGGGYFRKALEAALTVLIEALWSKQRILEVYLNSVEFGPGIYGVEAAAQHYFRKSAAQLTAFEAARLAAVLPNPRKWRVATPGPYVLSRVAWIERQMGYGSRSAAAAAADPEPLLPPDEPLPPQTDAAAPTAENPAPEPPPQAEFPVPGAGAPKTQPMDWQPAVEPTPVP